MLDLATGREIAGDISRRIGASHYCERFEVCGSIRRGRPQVHDIDLVVIPKDEDRGWYDITKWAESVVVPGERMSRGMKIVSFTGRFQVGSRKVDAQVDINRATEESWGMLVLAKTGSAQHNVWMAKEAQRLGMKFCPTRGLVRDGHCVAGRDEEAVFKALGLPWIGPALREMRGWRPVWQR